jgi:hypothetical protein
LAEGLNHLRLLPLPDLDGMVPDALARPHTDRASASDRIPFENQDGRFGFSLILRG